MDETERLADRLVIFDCGELLVFDTPAEAAAAIPCVHDEAHVDAGALFGNLDTVGGKLKSVLQAKRPRLGYSCFAVADDSRCPVHRVACLGQTP